MVKYVQTSRSDAARAGRTSPAHRVVATRASTAGALKTRSERLHRFADRAEVEACLARMAGGETPMVRELPRQPGQQDTRWIHLLGPVEAAGAGAGPVRVDRESVLAAGPEARDARFARRTPRLPRPMRSNYPMSSLACRSKGGCCAEWSTWPAVRR